QRQIHFLVVVFEDAQIRDFFRKLGRCCRGVFASDAQQYHQAGVDFSAYLAANRHFRPAYSLHHSSHLHLLIVSRNIFPNYRELITCCSSWPVCAAAFPATAPHCTRIRPGLARLPPDRPTSRGRAYRSANDGPSHSSSLLECTTKRGPPHRQKE